MSFNRRPNLENGNIWKYKQKNKNKKYKSLISIYLLHQCFIEISSLIVVLFMIYVKLRNRYVSCLIILKFQNKKEKVTVAIYKYRNFYVMFDVETDYPILIQK